MHVATIPHSLLREGPRKRSVSLFFCKFMHRRGPANSMHSFGIRSVGDAIDAPLRAARGVRMDGPSLSDVSL